MTTRSAESPGGKPGVDQIEAEIARTREELADTVDELAARLDVKARTQARVRELRARTEPQLPALAGVLAAVVVASAVLVIYRRRRHAA